VTKKRNPLANGFCLEGGPTWKPHGEVKRPRLPKHYLKRVPVEKGGKNHTGGDSKVREENVSVSGMGG